MKAQSETPAGAGPAVVDAGERDSDELAEAIAGALISYPHCVVVRGLPSDKDRAEKNVVRLSRAVCALPGPGGMVFDPSTVKVSFTRVRNDETEAAKGGNVTRFSRTAMELPAHTDSSYMSEPHELIAFQMVVADDHGGESVLLPVEDLLRQLDGNTMARLRDSVFPFGESIQPILYGEPGQPRIRFYEHQLTRSGETLDGGLSAEHQSAFERVRELTDVGRCPIRYFLRPGEILFMHNAMVMHGRTGFEEDSERLMYRVRIHAPVLKAAAETAEEPEDTPEIPAVTDLVFDETFVRQLIRKGSHEKARSICASCLDANPKHVDALLLMGESLATEGRIEDAQDPLGKAYRIAPDSISVLRPYGELQLRLGNNEEAQSVLTKLASLDPHDYHGNLALSALLRERGELSEARAILARVMRRHPYRVPRRRNPQKPTVLRLRGLQNSTYGITGKKGSRRKLLQGGHFAHTHLMEGASYNWITFNISEDNINQVDKLPHYDLILNSIACPDLERSSLLSAARFIDRQPQVPLINHPREVLKTSREKNALRLAAIEGIEFPLTERFWFGAETKPAAVLEEAEALGFQYPIIVRKAGSQTGLSVLLAHDQDELLGYYEKAERQRSYYLIQYQDCITSRGFYNKTRIFCIDGHYYPVANLFVDNWAIHSGDRYRVMDKHRWMQEEERAYLEDPVAYLGSDTFRRFAEVRDLMGLDFFGIDFTRREDGSIFIFEVNPAMRHNYDHVKAFPYTEPHLRRVSRAFDLMARRRIDQGQRVQIS